MKNFEIFVASHKKCVFPDSNLFTPIHVGSKFSNQSLNILRDDVNDNISIKNHLYCELTAHYWIWKNSNSKIIGLCHYRRYFNFTQPLIITRKTLNYNNINIVSSKLENPIALLDYFEFLVPKIYILPCSIKTHFILNHGESNYNYLNDVIFEHFPDYFNTWDIMMNNTNQVIFYNMLIAKKNNFDAYSDWLFKILFEVEKLLINNNNTTPRMIGYMSERLLQLYIFHNKKSYKEIDLFFFTEKKINKSQLIFDNLNMNLTFFLNKLIFCYKKLRKNILNDK